MIDMNFVAFMVVSVHLVAGFSMFLIKKRHWGLKELKK